MKQMEEERGNNYGTKSSILKSKHITESMKNIMQSYDNDNR
jgi:hypothetical protein